MRGGVSILYIYIVCTRPFKCCKSPYARRNGDGYIIIILESRNCGRDAISGTAAPSLISCRFIRAHAHAGVYGPVRSGVNEFKWSSGKSRFYGRGTRNGRRRRPPTNPAAVEYSIKRPGARTLASGAIKDSRPASGGDARPAIARVRRHPYNREYN